LYLSPFEGSNILDESSNTPDKTSHVTWPRGGQLNLGGKRRDINYYNARLSTLAYFAKVVMSFRINLSQATAAFIRAMVESRV
jgi:hypothetical protein